MLPRGVRDLRLDGGGQGDVGNDGHTLMPCLKSMDARSRHLELRQLILEASTRAAEVGSWLPRWACLIDGHHFGVAQFEHRWTRS